MQPCGRKAFWVCVRNRWYIWIWDICKLWISYFFRSNCFCVQCKNFWFKCFKKLFTIRHLTIIHFLFSSSLSLTMTDDIVISKILNVKCYFQKYSVNGFEGISGPTITRNVRDISDHIYPWFLGTMSNPYVIYFIIFIWLHVPMYQN